MCVFLLLGIPFLTFVFSYVAFMFFFLILHSHQYLFPFKMYIQTFNSSIEFYFGLWNEVMVWPLLPKYIFSQKTTSYWFIKHRHIYIYNNQPSNLFPHPMEGIICFPSVGLWSDGKNGIWSNLVWMHLGKATCWTHFPVRHGCWYQKQLLGYIYINHLHIPTLPQERHYHTELLSSLWGPWR